MNFFNTRALWKTVFRILTLNNENIFMLILEEYVSFQFYLSLKK